MAVSAAAPSQTLFTLEGKTALITGAGISLEYASLLLSQNCNVVIADLALRPEAEALVKKYQSSPKAIFQKTDVTDWGQLAKAFAVATAEFDSLDIVCPGAGIFEPHWSNFFQPPGSPNSKSKDPVDGLGHYALFDINLIHPIRATQLAIAEFMKPSQGGSKVSTTNPKRIVHIASTAGQASFLPVALYCASKHAIVSFVRSMGHLEDTLGIRVNAVAPGVVKTPLWTEHPEKMAMLDEEKDEWVTPQEVAEAMVKLTLDPEMVGGTILEIGHEQTRIVPEWGNMGPTGSGFTSSNVARQFEEVYEWLAQDNWGKVSK